MNKNNYKNAGEDIKAELQRSIKETNKECAAALDKIAE